jgi:hypothetical protein
MLRRTRRVTEVPAPVAARERQEERLDPFRGVSRQRTAESKRLIVGMRRNNQEP